MKVIYQNHIDWLKSINYGDSTFVVQSYQGLFNRLNLKRNPFFDKFWEFDKWLDNHRDENFFEVFPEYSDFTTYFN